MCAGLSNRCTAAKTYLLSRRISLQAFDGRFNQGKAGFGHLQAGPVQVALVFRTQALSSQGEYAGGAQHIAGMLQGVFDGDVGLDAKQMRFAAIAKAEGGGAGGVGHGGSPMKNGVATHRRQTKGWQLCAG